MPRRQPLKRTSIRMVGAGLAVVLWATLAAAVEQAEEFVTGLVERGMHAQALDYLERIESSPLIDDTFRQRIGYHRALVQIERAKQLSDPDERSRLLDEANQSLQAYAEANPDDTAGAEARGQLAGALVERAKASLARLEVLRENNAPQAHRERVRSEALALIDQARAIYQQTEAFYVEQRAEIPKTLDPKTQQRLIDQRQELGGRVAQSRILGAQLAFERARAYPPGDSEFIKLNEAAAEELGALYEKYDNWLIGSYAHLYEGRCYQAIGKYKEALGCYEDLVTQSETNPAFRRLMSVAHRHMAECYLAQEQYDAAISQTAAWLDKARGAEGQSPEWLAVRYQLAEAYRQKAEALADNAPGRRNLLSNAREAYRMVSRHPNEFQLPARLAARDLGRGSASAAEPKTFDEAYQAGRAALADMNAAQISLGAAERNAPEAVPELEAQIDESHADAMHLLETALALVDEDTDLATINEIRYFLCRLYWQAKDYYRSAILGEFLSRRYPEHRAAIDAAKVAMASYERLYSEAVAGGEDQQATEFEARRLADMAEFITRRWPGTEDAERAFSVLLSFALRHDRITEAKQILDKVTPDRRGQLELKLGSSIWARYLEASQADELDQEQLSSLEQETIEFLESGLATARQAGDITATTATGSLYLVQALLSDGQYDRAIEVLEDDTVGPLALVEQGHRAAAREGYEAEAFKVALRSYVSVVPPESDKAIATMTKLEKSVEGDAGAADRLTRIYIGLGLQLQQQIADLKVAGKSREAERVVAAFAQLLSHVADRQQAAGWAARSWIAETYYNMAEQLDGSASARQQARQYFARARDAFQQMLDEADQRADFAPSPSAVLAARMKLGQCQRQLGEYESALDTFSSLLRDKEARLDVQRAAALTYEERGIAEDARWLERAIFGGRKLRSTGKFRIWGWLKLAQVAARASERNPKYRDTFFEARLHAARCRYLAGTKAEGAKQKEDFAKAEAILSALVRLYPDLGGDPWRAEFDRLAKQIQNSRGEQPVGLKAWTDVAARS